MRPLHVLWVPSWYPDTNNPLNGSFFREQVQMLRRAGMKVGVVALNAVKPWQYSPKLRVSSEEGITLVRGSVPGMPHEKLPFEGELFRFACRRALATYAKAEGIPQLVHAHSVYPAITVASQAAHSWQVPYCLTEHRPSSTERDLSVGRGKHIRAEVRQAAGRATVSKPFAEVLQRYYDTPPWQVIALPVPEAAFALPFAPVTEQFTILHVSHLGNNKRPKMLLRAFAKARQNTPNLHLRIVGAGAAGELQALSALARSLGVEEGVEFLGALDRQQVFAQLSRADAFVLPSAVEAGGTVLAEAQAVGLPCVATETWAGRFMVEEDTGITVPVDDVQALAGALGEVARPGRFDRAQIRQRGRERFSEQTFVRDTRQLYCRTLSS